MKYEKTHPAEVIASIMRRTYQQGLTTTSGGNLTQREADGSVWVTPTHMDKATMNARDMMCVAGDGQISGINEVTSEFPFHDAVLRQRPDMGSVLHAHSPALVSFSFLRRAPRVKLFPALYARSGDVGIAPFATPGTDRLADEIRGVFAKGLDAAIMENHGVVVAGHSAWDAFVRFECIEWCAHIELEAARLGYHLDDAPPNADAVSEAELLAAVCRMPEKVFPDCLPGECVAREVVCDWGERSYLRHLIPATGGSMSMRFGPQDFVVTPFGRDRLYLTPDSVVRVSGDEREAGKTPDPQVFLHQAIYRQHPGVQSVIIAMPPNVMAFGLAGKPLRSEVGSEVYMVVRQMPHLPGGAWATDPQAVARHLNLDTPAAIFENDCVAVVGKSPFDTYDRIEVAEFTAKSVKNAETAGAITALTKRELNDIKERFPLEPQACRAL